MSAILMIAPIIIFGLFSLGYVLFLVHMTNLHNKRIASYDKMIREYKEGIEKEK